MFEADYANPTTLMLYLLMLVIAGLLGFLVRYSTESKKISDLKQKLVRVNSELHKYANRE